MMQEKNWLEWLVFAVGLLLVGGTLGFLLYDASTAENLPPEIHVRLGTPEGRPGYYAVPVTAWNQGSETAESVRIEVVLGGEGGERAELEFPFLPGGGRREGWVTFTDDPGRTDTLQARVLGYKKP